LKPRQAKNASPRLHAVRTDNTKKAHALNLLMQRHGFKGKPSYPEDALSSVCALRLAVTGTTGKQDMPAQ